MATLKQPPVFDPDGGDSYQDWKCDVEVWKLFTKDEAKRIGPAVYLSLKGNAREAVRGIDAKELGNDDGYNKVMEALDKVYLKDETTRAFCAIKNFIEYRRESGYGFAKFFVEFNNRHLELTKHKLKFDDGLMGYFLLTAANLSDDHERLVRATAKLDFEDVRDKLQKVFGEFDGNDEKQEGSGALPVKEECLYTRYGQRGRSNRGSYSGEFHDDSRSNRDSYDDGRRNRDSYDNSRRNRGGRGRGRGRGGQHQGNRNPIGQDGNIMRCHECNSTQHFVDNCPNRRVEEANMTVHITLIAGSASEEQEVMLVESLARGILDSACTKTVAGKTWMDEFLSQLDEKERKIALNSKKASSSLYRFGDGQETLSKHEITVPMRICGKKMTISVDIVEFEIPLLISRPTMTQLGMVLDTANHTAIVDGKTIQLEFNRSGHYTIPVNDWTNKECNVVLHLEKLAKSTSAEKMSKAKKLHRQFAHASKERLIRLMKTGGCNDKEFIKAIVKCCDTCEFCQRYRKPKPRPIVGLPKATRFNEFVELDLKEMEKGKQWILHLVDTATGYTAASMIYAKKKDIVVDKILKIWMAYFGSPLKLHNDNGGEFANEVFMEMNEKFGIETSTTPGEAPFSNAKVERGNAMLYETTMKTMEDTKCGSETALAWAVSAKNSLQNESGYSPNQLVIGQNGRLPSLLNDAPPALHPTTNSDLVRENLNALHKARENFIKSEASERIRKALKHNVRTYSEVDFQPGDKVYYKRRKTKGWKGPAKVLGKESNFVLIRQGSVYYRCHPCQLMKIGDEKDTSHTEDKRKKQLAIKKTPLQDAETPLRKQHVESSSDDDEQSDINQDEVDGSSDDEHQVDEDPISEQSSEETSKQQRVANSYIDSDHISDEELDNGIIDCIPDEDVDDADEEQEGREDGYNGAEMLSRSETQPKRNTIIQYCMPDQSITKAKVLSTQPKKQGKWKDWVNVQVVGKDEASSVNWKDVVWWREARQAEDVMILTSIDHYSQEIVDAKEKEYKNLLEHDVFEVVNDDGQSTISTKWIFHEKNDDQGRKSVKGRLVARGFEERLADKKIDSPTCSRQGLRLVLITASSMDWEIKSMDISAAFLQGNQLTRPVFIQPPTELQEEGKIWKLKRCLYGLSDAPREWYNRLSMELKKLGGTISLYDKSMFIWHNKTGELEGLISIHVDDFEYCGTSQWHNNVIDRLCIMFKISSQQTGSFKYVGLNIEQNGTEIFVDQQAYIEELTEISIERSRKTQLDDQLNNDEKKTLRSVSGQLLWTTSQTRPDLAFQSCIISNYGAAATVKSLSEANKAIRKLKNDSMKMCFPGLGNPNYMKIVAYGDGSHASLPSGASQGANIVFLAGNGRAAPVTWKSKKLDRITKSPLASEVMAVADAADSGFLVASIVQEIFQLRKAPSIDICTDSKSLQEHLETKKVIQDPRLRVDTARLREMTEIGEVEIKWVPTRLMLADALTKNCASTELLRQVLVSGKLPDDL